MKRTVVWFSCGATSAVSAWLAVKDMQFAKEATFGEHGYELDIVYCDTGGEHPSNAKFLTDVEEWIGQPITILKSEKYKDHFDVFEKRKYIAGISGAPCTLLLKKRLREEYQRADDIHIFGFSVEERKRAALIAKNLPELSLRFNLIESGLSKADCLGLLVRMGIELPEMYKLGYDHNNCIGCPKGQQGYWNKIRVDFPDVFERMALLERSLDVAVCKTYAGDNKRKRLFLDELDPSAGRDMPTPSIECSLFCQMIAEE